MDSQTFLASNTVSQYHKKAKHRLREEKDRMKEEEDHITEEEDRMREEEDRMREEEDHLRNEEDRLRNEEDCLRNEEDRLRNEEDRLRNEEDRLRNEEDRLRNEEDRLRNGEDRQLPKAAQPRSRRGSSTYAHPATPHPQGLKPLHKRFEDHTKQTSLTSISKLVGEGGNADSIDLKIYIDSTQQKLGDLFDTL
ncbi:hypothetical protein HHX47_DHR3000744 [Lentinula edodes]|nr:hypothetical protein HHX47_DHR3000744 [Lentinula edodes]